MLLFAGMFTIEASAESPPLPGNDFVYSVLMPVADVTMQNSDLKSNSFYFADYKYLQSSDIKVSEAYFSMKIFILEDKIIVGDSYPLKCYNSTKKIIISTKINENIIRINKDYTEIGYSVKSLYSLGKNLNTIRANKDYTEIGYSVKS